MCPAAQLAAVRRVESHGTMHRSEILASIPAGARSKVASEMNRDRQMALQTLGSLTGAAVIIAGLLYLIGIMVTSAELWHAGVSMRDTVPLLSLEQLLGRGVSLVLPTIGLLLLAIAGLATYWRVERRFQSHVTDRLPEIATHIPPADRDEWLATTRSEAERLHGTIWRSTSRKPRTTLATAMLRRRSRDFSAELA